MEIGTPRTMPGKMCCGAGGGWHLMGCPSNGFPRLRMPTDALLWGKTEPLMRFAYVVAQRPEWGRLS